MIDKFTTKFQIEAKVQAIKFAKECEKVADEYAIGFAEWFHENCYEDNVGYYRAEELLEIYKKTL